MGHAETPLPILLSELLLPTLASFGGSFGSSFSLSVELKLLDFEEQITLTLVDHMQGQNGSGQQQYLILHFQQRGMGKLGEL